MTTDHTLSPGSPDQSAYTQRGLDDYLTHLQIYGRPDLRDDGASIALRLKSFHINGGGCAHGGLVMSLMDAVMACATAHKGGGRHCVTVEMKTQFIRPGGQAGDLIIARADWRGGGNTLAFCDAQITDEQGTLLATASGTFRFIGAARHSM